MLRIEITKRDDGGGLLRCTRSDGSSTWQKQSGRHAAHFALHDLTHFAIESALRMQNGFFGLIAQGWDIADTEGKGVRGPVPTEAVLVEYLAGCFDMERASGLVWMAEDFNQHAAIHAEAGGRPAPAALSDDDLARVRTLRAELFARWFALPEAAALTLDFIPIDEQSLPHRSGPAPARSHR